MTSALTIFDQSEVQLIDHMGTDMRFVQAAQVSVKGANEVFEMEGHTGLINYLMRERHGSPFEHCAMTFYVKTPIFTTREFMRHRIASYNEMSGRYMELPAEFYIPGRNRPQVNVGSSAKPVMAEGTEEQYHEMVDDLMETYQFTWDKYQRALKRGDAKELARIHLPVGIMTQFYVTMNFRAMCNFMSLRTQRENARHLSRPQWEIEEVAEQIELHVADLYPVAYAAFEKHGRVAP